MLPGTEMKISHLPHFCENEKRIPLQLYEHVLCSLLPSSTPATTSQVRINRVKGAGEGGGGKGKGGREEGDVMLTMRDRGSRTGKKSGGGGRGLGTFCKVDRKITQALL